MEVIAICSNISNFDMGSLAWNEPTVTDQFPGSGWIRYLELYASKLGVQVLPGVKALRSVNNKEIDPKDIYVVQEEFNILGESLVDKGANASLVFCLESPLYASSFYKSIESFQGGPYQARLFFGNLGTHQAYFPSFDAAIPFDASAWNTRSKWGCMVNSHKYLNSSDINELQSARYAIIESLKKLKRDSFDLYGKGWPRGFGVEIPPGDKLKIISQYRYNVCLENYSMSGYLSEKLIECLQAGCLPVYLGAPDVFKYIPIECFHNPEAGPEFIRSTEASRFSYQAFARQVLDLLGNNGL